VLRQDAAADVCGQCAAGQGENARGVTWRGLAVRQIYLFRGVPEPATVMPHSGLLELAV